MKKPVLLAAAALFALTGSAAFAEDVQLGSLTLKDAWTRATPPKAKGGGAFVTITNNGTEDAKLLGASSEYAKRTEVHEMKVADGVMQMRHMADGLVIPAGETLELKPGSYHVMFMGLKQPIKQGEVLNVTLQFDKAGDVELQFPAMKMGAKTGKPAN